MTIQHTTTIHQHTMVRTETMLKGTHPLTGLRNNMGGPKKKEAKGKLSCENQRDWWHKKTVKQITHNSLVSHMEGSTLTCIDAQSKVVVLCLHHLWGQQQLPHKILPLHGIWERGRAAKLPDPRNPLVQCTKKHSGICWIQPSFQWEGLLDRNCGC